MGFKLELIAPRESNARLGYADVKALPPMISH